MTNKEFDQQNINLNPAEMVQEGWNYMVKGLVDKFIKDMDRLENYNGRKRQITSPHIWPYDDED